MPFDFEDTALSDIQSRKLVAILAADIAGYSALMGADEEATVRQLKGHQAVVLPMIPAYGGRVIDTAGDGIMAEFASVLNAVRCAVAIQEVMATRNAAIDPPQQMQFRIGINLGDVIYDETRIYGDGINVATRLEGIAEPGGICISDKVHQRDTRQDRCCRRGRRPAEPEKYCRTVPGSSRRRRGRSASTDTEAGADTAGQTVNCRIALRQLERRRHPRLFQRRHHGRHHHRAIEIPELFVIARNSSFQYKGKSLDIRQVGRELGVRYVLEGSIRRAGDRVRITGQLIDAARAVIGGRNGTIAN